jgi:D-alanyl-D-alanine carboxypeptidase
VAGRQQMSAAARHQQEMRAAAAQAAASRAAGGLRQDNSVTGEVGDCTGGDDVGQYANGQIPLSALCPLAADPGQRLRADAAYAFDRLTYAYTEHFGAAPCVTDSYRSYAAQVDVYARKPGLAAVPGTSNHGWGTALDLCAGIESFSSRQHMWMLLNAPLYGWFHPSWAEPSGSKPEPWHWEFAS